MIYRKETMKTNALAMLLPLISTTLGSAAGQAHHVAIHVDENDEALMNMALNNAANVSAHYAAQGDEVVIELVAYGPGLVILIPGTSPVEQRTSAMVLEMPNLSLAACGNTHRKMSEKADKEVPLMEEAAMAPSGVVRLIELQEQG